MSGASSGFGSGSSFAAVRLENWRNFLQVRVALQRRTFIVGPNAAGKSNFLDVFRFLRDLVAEGGGFRESVARRGGVSAIRCLSARRYSDVKVEVVVVDHSAQIEWEYKLHFGQDTQRRPLVKHERVVRNGTDLFARPDAEDKGDPERLTQTSLEQVNVNREFRDLVSFLRSVRYLHVVPQLVRDPTRSVGLRDDPYGGDFLEQLARTNERTRISRLGRIRDALRVAVPQLREIELWRDERGTPHLRGKFEHWRPQGAWQAEDQFSDGTLRLLGLLWSALDGTGPLLLEEPELSLHPEIVRLLPPMFARVQRRQGRQILLSSHSPELLRDQGIGLNEVLLLTPEEEGTSVRTAADYQDIRVLLEGGVDLGEAVLPHTRPREVQQLLLFGNL
jgi:predicted ATPase